MRGGAPKARMERAGPGFPDDPSHPAKTLAQSCFGRKRERRNRLAPAGQPPTGADAIRGATFLVLFRGGAGTIETGRMFPDFDR